MKKFEPLSTSFKTEVIHFLQEMIQTPSVNGENPEIEIAKVITAFAQKHELSVESTALEADRPNVLVQVGPKGKTGLLLIGHMDTVPTGKAENWNDNPFSGKIEGNQIFGRGAIDNKGGIAAAMGALLLLKQQSFSDLKRPLMLACVPDEESGATGRLGIKHLHRLNKLSGSGAIYTYPYLSETAIGHRGVLRLKIVTQGKSCHTGLFDWQEADKSLNAITGMSDILLELEKLKFEAAETPALFKRFHSIITSTIIQGGAGQSIVPDTCEAVIDVRLVPSNSKEFIIGKIQTCLDVVQQRRPGLKIELNEIINLPPTIISENEPIVLAIRTAVKEVIGKEPAVVVSGPANESYLLNKIGIPTCTLGPEGAGAHSVNEFCYLDSLFQTIEIYAKVALILSEGN